MAAKEAKEPDVFSFDEDNDNNSQNNQNDNNNDNNNQNDNNQNDNNQNDNNQNNQDDNNQNDKNENDKKDDKNENDKNDKNENDKKDDDKNENDKNENENKGDGDNNNAMAASGNNNNEEDKNNNLNEEDKNENKDEKNENKEEKEEKNENKDEKKDEKKEDPKITIEKPKDKDKFKVEEPVKMEVKTNYDDADIEIVYGPIEVDPAKYKVFNPTLIKVPTKKDYKKGDDFALEADKIGKAKWCMAFARDKKKFTLLPTFIYIENERTYPLSKLSLSDKGLEFIKSCENTRKDMDGNHIAHDSDEGYATIGYGHIIEKKKCEEVDSATIQGITKDEFEKGITDERATEILKADLADAEKAVKKDITVPLFPYEYDALVSLVYSNDANFLSTKGDGGKDTEIKKKINDLKYEDGAKEFEKFTNDGDPALRKRRRDEMAIFIYNAY
jgi:GH24 family phage-related lysozyme (muramidase)